MKHRNILNISRHFPLIKKGLRLLPFRNWHFLLLLSLKAYKRLEKANLIKVYYKEINNKIFVCANTKELGFFIGNFLLYCLRNNLKSFYYTPKIYFKELF